MLSRKYEPKSIEEMIGNKSNALKVLELVKQGKPVLIHGRPGIGKTLTAKLVAKALNYDLILLSSDETRTAKAMERIVEAQRQKSLFKSGKLIVVDDADKLESLDFVEKLAKSGFPVIVICNDPYASKLYKLQKLFTVVKFQPVRKDAIVRLLKRIAQKEGIKADERTILIIASSVNGDVRAALNSLESLSHDYRDSLLDIFKTLGIIFKSSFSSAYQAIMDSEKDVDTISLWLSENIANEYEKAEEIEKAYYMLSKAYVWRRQISEGTWTMMPLITSMVAGVSVAKEKPYRKFTRYRPPARFYKSEYMSFPHISSRKLMSDNLLKRIIRTAQRQA